ncbi:MAG: hypothetical protein F4X14_17780 [Caldilineaceae bacterium SB0661_bin_32]|uniref:Uncharacterized protein n=1 Tax=Caldilineaceae bacterium SB0661_bin_32 TaxID=2605255 RepID=A0A6B1D9V6_9CHLR|nr:hypothetical protein [Caldilineaceae bacterium SB0661_bin_32]
MTRETSDQTPIWCGIHYLLYLRLAGAEEDCARFSLFQTEYSPAGGGNAGFLYIDPECLSSAPASCVYTDNPEMAEWMYNRMYRDSDNSLAACGNRVITARFGRGGDMRQRLGYSIDSADGTVGAAWTDLETPFVHHGLAGRSGLYTYCLFVVANGAGLEVNGEMVPGDLYARQDWIPLVGRPLSSCLIADEIWAAT